MPVSAPSQTELIVGVDVGGTFTDLVASDGERLHVVKVPSTPSHFERGVIEAVARIAAAIGDAAMKIVHGSTVATNALLQRAGELAAPLPRPEHAEHDPGHDAARGAESLCEALALLEAGAGVSERVAQRAPCERLPARFPRDEKDRHQKG